MNQHRVQIVQWSDQIDVLRTIRETVFIQEQHVPVELEWDEFDEISWHALAYNAANQPVGTARLLPDGRIGRMAVLKEWRGKGFGRALLLELLAESQRQKMKSVQLNAQISASSFYQKYGFVEFGDEFMEAGIPHVAMRLEI